MYKAHGWSQTIRMKIIKRIHVCLDSYLTCANVIELCVSAHTKESGQALVDMIKMAFPVARLVLVVAMANDKDHLGFSRVLLSG